MNKIVLSLAIFVAVSTMSSGCDSRENLKRAEASIKTLEKRNKNMKNNWQDSPAQVYLLNQNNKGLKMLRESEGVLDVPVPMAALFHSDKKNGKRFFLMRLHWFENDISTHGFFLADNSGKIIKRYDKYIQWNDRESEIFKGRLDRHIFVEVFPPSPDKEECRSMEWITLDLELLSQPLNFGLLTAGGMSETTVPLFIDSVLPNNSADEK